MSLALSLCQYVLRPWRGLAQASPGLAWLRPGLGEPRSASIASLHQHNRKGKILMIKTRRYKRLVLGFVFCTWNWYDFGDGVGASLVVGAEANKIKSSFVPVNFVAFALNSGPSLIANPQPPLSYMHKNTDRHTPHRKSGERRGELGSRRARGQKW